MKKNFFHYIMYTIFSCIIILQCDDVFTDNPQAAGDESTRPVTVAELSEKTRVIRGDFLGEPALAAGEPFRFSINELAPSIDVKNVFVTASGYKVHVGSDNLVLLDSPVQISWQVVHEGDDYIVELLVKDADGNLYEDPGLSPYWDGYQIKLHFHAYYVSEMPVASYME